MNAAGSSYVRVGNNYDGLYVMLDDFARTAVDAAYSFGIVDDAPSEEAVASRGIDVFIYDHTIRRLPKQHAKCHYVGESDASSVHVHANGPILPRVIGGLSLLAP